MPALDFDSTSNSENEGDLEDWEIAAAQRKKEREAQKAAEEAKAEETNTQKARDQLRNRDREHYDGSDDGADLTADAKARMNRRMREQQSIDAARNMFKGASDDSDNEADKARGRGVARDYTVENEFMKADGNFQSAAGASIEGLQPQTIEQFETLADKIVLKMVSTLQRTKGGDNDVLYMAMFKRIIEGALGPMYPEDAKELSAVCARISADKSREEAAKKKKKFQAAKAGSKSNKPQLNVGGSATKFHKYDADDSDFI